MLVVDVLYNSITAKEYTLYDFSSFKCLKFVGDMGYGLYLLGELTPLSLCNALFIPGNFPLPEVFFI